MFRWVALMGFLAAMSPTWIAASETCAARFDALNRRHMQLEHAPPDSSKIAQSGLRDLESDLFAALSECPRDAELYSLMGELQISLGELPIATAYGQKAIELDSSSWRAWQLLGSSLAMSGRYTDGIAALERAAELVPENMGIKVNLASAFAADGQFARALELSDALRHSTDRALAAAAHHIRGLVFSGQGDLKAAAQEFNAANALGFQTRYSLPRQSPKGEPAEPDAGATR